MPRVRAQRVAAAAPNEAHQSTGVIGVAPKAAYVWVQEWNNGVSVSTINASKSSTSALNMPPTMAGRAGGCQRVGFGAHRFAAGRNATDGRLSSQSWNRREGRRPAVPRSPYHPHAPSTMRAARALRC